MEETHHISKNKSTMLLIAAILFAVAVILWVILSFDRSVDQDNIGQSKIRPIMVSNTVSLHHEPST